LSQTSLFFRLIQFIHLRRHYQIRLLMDFQPSLQVQVLLHPSAPCDQHQDGKLQSLSSQQIAFNELFPLEPYFFGNPRESVPRKIDEMTGAADSIKIDRLSVIVAPFPPTPALPRGEGASSADFLHSEGHKTFDVIFAASWSHQPANVSNYSVDLDLAAVIGSHEYLFRFLGFE